MLGALRYLLWLVGRLVLSLRYRVRVHGGEKLDGLKGPVLVLPNHPAYIDPPLVMMLLWRRLDLRPLLFGGNFNNPLLYPIMKVLDGVELPDTDRPGRRIRKQTEAAIQALIDGLKAGRNHIMWPSGHVQRRTEETLGSARALGDVLRAVPEAKVLLVRTVGLRGSMFSYARTGKKPDLVGSLLRGLGYLLANLLFFMPRRRVDITLELLDRSALPAGDDRRALNHWFEEWYNRSVPPEPIWVPYHFLLGRREFDWPAPSATGGVDPARITPRTRAEVGALLARELKRDLRDEELTAETALDELGLDSLRRAALALRAEQLFGFPGDEVPSTVGELWALAQGLGRRSEPRPTPREWFARPRDDGPVAILGDTLPEAFVERALSCRKDVAVADDLAGVLTYQQLLVRVLMLSRRLARLEGTNVGLLLPASAACDVALLALQLAGKVPVVLNWTTGEGNLKHAAGLTGLKAVVTADAFLDRLADEVVEALEEVGVEWKYLEDLCENTKTEEVARRRPLAHAWRLASLGVEMLATGLRVRWRPGRVRGVTPRPAADRPAVILFTSGSEKAPKAVPLTHRNLLSNQRAAITILKVSRTDSILGFLPAFHSFGLSVTGLVPLLGGMRVVHHADPTDARALVRKVATYKVTLLAATPTFLGYILDRADEGQRSPSGAGPQPLESLRFIFVGAEKCPAILFERAGERAPRALMLEGYGITECSPIVSVNPPEAPRRGSVGKPLPGVEVCPVRFAFDSEGVHPGPGPALPPGEQGLLLVGGPGVFPGYLGQAGPGPFTQRDGQRWYVTGDLAKIDADGYIYFAGRLKRFIKVGGEMISLPELEAALAKHYPPRDTPAGGQAPRVAVEAVELDGEHKIALFTTLPLGLAEANDLLEKEGIRGVKRLTEVRQVQSIPVLGTKGSPDYKVLRAQLTA